VRGARAGERTGAAELALHRRPPHTGVRGSFQRRSRRPGEPGRWAASAAGDATISARGGKPSHGRRKANRMVFKFPHVSMRGPVRPLSRSQRGLAAHGRGSGAGETRCCRSGRTGQVAVLWGSGWFRGAGGRWADCRCRRRGAPTTSGRHGRGGCEGNEASGLTAQAPVRSLMRPN